ncbi:MAG: N-acetylmuramoyl-L-alanine amidase, partial [Floccifex porci]|uniref:N-acetylmuramoyl-L-alanine amidase n=1 Tax=Floccifex porci TaxID=2606629 RepID=UPI003EFFF529
MKKVLKLSFSIFLAMTMSLSNVVSIFAQEEESEQIVEIQDEIENEDLDVEENINSEEMNVESQIEDSDTNTELTGDSTCIEYFLLEESNVSSTQNFVLSLLKDEGYTNFSIDVSDAYGNLFNVESNERVNNLIKFTESFSSGAYIVTKIHYQLNEQNYVIFLSDIGIEAKFGVNQEVYSENELVDLEDISEGSSSQEGVVSIDSENVNSSSEIIEEELNVPQSYSISSYALDNESDEIILCLDPGHGGSESGTYTYYSSQNGLYEKYYNLKIAQYCKQELEKYANVKLYLTRYDDTYLDLKERAQIASDYGASYLISFHLNGLNGTNRGAVIFYPNTNYRPDLSEDGKVVAQSVLNELTALGIQSMGIRTNTIDGHDEKYDYPDGSEGDYYGVIRHAKNLGITGLIIEHCFADNKADFDAFLSSESKLQNLGIADATGIAKALGLSIDTTTMDQLAYENKDVLKDGTYEIFNGSDFNKSISVKDASINENATIIQDNSSTDSNGWSVSHDEKGYVIITNKLSGKVLSLNSDSLFQNQSVIQKENNNSYLNKWIVKKENSSYKIVSAVKSNYVLACIDNKVVIQQEENNKNQEWILNSYTPIRTKIDAYAAENKSSISDGTYIIGT